MPRTSGYGLAMIARPWPVALLALAAACSSSSTPTALCGGGATATLTVSVVNDTNEALNICDAKVVATGPSTVTLAPTGGSSTSSCGYAGTLPAGSYSITASGSGFETVSVEQVIQAGCNATAAIDVTPTM
jgi:hypothetical protein